MEPRTQREILLKILDDCKKIQERLDRIEKKLFNGIEQDVISLKTSQNTIKWSLGIGLSIFGLIITILTFIVMVVK